MLVTHVSWHKPRKMTIGREVQGTPPREEQKGQATSSRELTREGVCIPSNRVDILLFDILWPTLGKHSPTSSYLSKRILPLDTEQPPTVFLLHPFQPLSCVSRLIYLPGRVTGISSRSAAECTAQRDHQNLQDT
jgi:hypothetical protein